jgi:hypothetical protein
MRHVWVLLVANRSEQEAAVRFARHDCLPAFAATHQRLAGDQVEAALGLFAAVTFHAVQFEHRQRVGAFRG